MPSRFKTIPEVHFCIILRSHLHLRTIGDCSLCACVIAYLYDTAYDMRPSFLSLAIWSTWLNRNNFEKQTAPSIHFLRPNGVCGAPKHLRLPRVPEVLCQRFRVARNVGAFFRSRSPWHLVRNMRIILQRNICCVCGRSSTSRLVFKSLYVFGYSEREPAIFITDRA